jgi:hypothetical protein
VLRSISKMSSADDSPRDRSTMEESFNARFSMNIDSHVERGHGRTTNRSRVDGTLAVRTTARVAVLLEEGKELQLRPSIAKFGGLILNTPPGPQEAISGGLLIIPTGPKEAIVGRLLRDTPTEASYRRNSVDSY